MKTCFWYRSAAIRADYSRHVLRAMAQGFKPMSLEQFGQGYARSFYLTGNVQSI